MIQEQYVSFETAKLLEEKGFDTKKSPRHSTDKGPFIYITHQSACQWLRKTHEILISINPTVDKDNMLCIRYYIWELNNSEDATISGIYSFDSYDECMENAIKYCVEKLI